ncbi:MAG: hypothetical protein BEU00_01680 [Marine Group III euryarchaeote CG-Epi3]|uniref:Uncharacterized protein n=1 Tax=Marine Group III euryarchaeote CG-Epi3 TaxID=1888997 RepID=A0A1J5UEV0_9ARCH|nr:hypothetical protein [Candidatus Poseidoniia archaeon]OIR22822.1 MAG: hypothetical protein BEU00_01680 [Marine Group III euryarchaeote CG-Epi3]|tara:strand:- start:1242 stop:1655 length:414 start_codon:yes stop_codon:yes gene_type:complete
MEEKPGNISWILSNMPLVAIIEGGFLALFGVFAYLYSGQSSFTALIPSIFGLGILIPGYVAYSNPGVAKHAMHVTAVFGLLGILGSLDSILGFLDGKYSLANISKGVLLIICGEYLYFCILSFRAARIKREQEALQK